MGCGCGGKSGKKMEYLVINAKGESMTYRTDMEARMAVARAGGGRVEPREVK